MSWLTGLKKALVVQDEGVALPARGILNITGPGITASDDPANGRTNLAFTADVVGTKDATPNTLAARGSSAEAAFGELTATTFRAAAEVLIAPASGAAAFSTYGNNVLVGDGGDTIELSLNASDTVRVVLGSTSVLEVGSGQVFLTLPTVAFHPDMASPTISQGQASGSGTTPGQDLILDLQKGQQRVSILEGDANNDGGGLWVKLGLPGGGSPGPAGKYGAVKIGRGTLPASGMVRAEDPWTHYSGQLLTVRGAALSADVAILGLDGSDNILIGAPTNLRNIVHDVATGQSHIISVNSSAALTVAKGTVGITANATIATPRTFGTGGPTAAFDLSGSNHQQLTLAGDCTVTFSNLKNGATYVLHFIQDGAGSHVATWPASIKVAGGGGPGALSTGANQHDVMVLECDGTNLWMTAFVKNLS